MYIKAATCISPQNTFEEGQFSGDIINHVGNKIEAQEPGYAEMIPRGLLRRMGKAARMGIGSGLTIIKQFPNLDGIVIGSTEGGLEESVKFLNQIVDYEEGTLTPTNFVQSTPNSVAGTLALMTNNTGYNTTHVNSGLAFESALLDALLLFEEGSASSLLLGCVDEISTYNYKIDSLVGRFKQGEVNSLDLFSLGTKGTICGEGAVMYAVDNSPENALAEIVDVAQISFPVEDQVENLTENFLNKNNLAIEDIDAVLLGLSGDPEGDEYYSKFVEGQFKNTAQYSFKNLVGDYGTASGFATWMATQLLNGNPIPAEAIIQENDKAKKNILIYNHFRRKQHGLILMRK